MKRLILFVSYLVIIIIYGCGRERERIFTRDFKAMGTSIQIKVFSKDALLAEYLLEKAENEINALDNKFNLYDKHSELSQLNRKGFIKASDDLFNCVKLALKYAKLTHGNFDPTLSPSTIIYKYKNKKEKNISANIIQDKFKLISYKYVRIDKKGKKIIFEREGIQIDLNLIAKGYAIDKIASLMDKGRIKKYFINFGGNIKVKGKEFIIGIKDQFGNILSLLSLKNKAIATSYNYPKKHIILPEMSKSSPECILASVISSSATQAEALSRALLTSGKKELPYIEKIQAEGVLLTKKADILKTKGFDKYIIKDFIIVSPCDYKTRLKQDYINHAKMAKEAGNYIEALENIKSAIEINPENPELYYELGNLYELLGEDEKSVAAYLKGLQIR